jgi:hypothetical protein
VPIRLALALVLLLAAALTAAAPPDLTAGGKPDANHDFNLGPTGLRGWIWAENSATTAARQIFVTQVDAGSPADGVIAPGDVILGIGDRPFSADARRAFGEAITEAEQPDRRGQLQLLRWRAGRTETVTLKLRPLGTYSATAPYACEKSARIIADGCRAIAAKRREPTPKDQTNAVVRSLDALALLASGDAEYLPLVRDEARWAAAYVAPAGSLASWQYAYVNLFLAEYALATGDRDVLPGLRRISLLIAGGQSCVGSWGHRLGEGGVLEGYGAMHQPGLPLTMSLVLARAAGVKDAAVDQAIERSARFIRFYAGKGAIPYGDHHPWLDTHEDNGKCGAGAVLFDLLDDPQPAGFFARMATASYGGERDTGHTGNFFNQLWALPGVSRCGPTATGAWVYESAWMLDLARRRDGTFAYQGRPGIPFGSSDHQYREWDCTSAYVLGYAVSLKRLRLTGSAPTRVPPLSPAEATAVIADGAGWSPDRKAFGYAGRGVDQLIVGLSSWSPVVRQRSADELARRDGDFVPRLLTLLGSREADGRRGAAQALAALGPRAAKAVPALRQTLWDDDLWLRVKSAEALAQIGEPARDAVPDLLKLVTASAQDDARGRCSGMSRSACSIPETC